MGWRYASRMWKRFTEYVRAMFGYRQRVDAKGRRVEKTQGRRGVYHAIYGKTDPWL